MRKKVRKCRFGIRRAAHGYTLVELLVALLMGGIVMTAIYNLFIVQSRSQWVQDQVADMQANARIAMERIAYDVRMAGFNMIGGAAVGYMGEAAPVDPMLGTDGGVNNSDQITLYYAPYAGSDCAVPELSLSGSIPVGSSLFAIDPLQNLNAAPYNIWDTGFTCGGQSFSVNDPAHMFKAVIICDSQHGPCSPPAADVVVITAVQTGANRLQIGAYGGHPNTVTHSYQPNSVIKFYSEAQFNGYAYRIDRTDPARPCLLRYTSGAGNPATDALAENIEDVQLVYITNTGAEVHGTGAISVANIRAVRITVLARTQHEDPQLKLKVAVNNCRPALENHNGDPAGAHDGYHRRVLSSVIQVRNFGI